MPSIGRGTLLQKDRVKILNSERELALGTKYSRVTVGFPMNIVTECKPFRRLAWATTVELDAEASAVSSDAALRTDLRQHLRRRWRRVGRFGCQHRSGDSRHGVAVVIASRPPAAVATDVGFGS
ncbi:MAG TPA: hypothetical protein VHS97_21480 [Isosphaeraceae bacterium]|jgi:hypothetical protein|nr:hypothetical protein [Isosphaeraceae bacterium]